MALELLSTLNRPYQSAIPEMETQRSIRRAHQIMDQLVAGDLRREQILGDYRDGYGKIHLGYVKADDVDLLCKYLPKDLNVKFYANDSANENSPWSACWLRPGYPEYLEYL